MEYVAIIALFFVFIPMFFFLIFKPVMADRKARNNINNSDTFTRNYCFLLNCSQADALDKLAIRNIYDPLECALDRDSMTIVFDASLEYKLSFRVVNNKTYLKVSKSKDPLYRGNIPLMINRFFIEKIGAIPVDYSFYRSHIDRTEN